MSKQPKILPALSEEALLGKSKVYISRALAAKSRKAMSEYQLWASLALELLGKSALAKRHPCLIADPQSYVSMFAAAGMSVGTDIKTITAKTLFERLTHVSKRFDKKTQEFCDSVSLRRNAELHSGEAPFEGVEPSSWEGRFWHAVEIILEARNDSLDQWIGANNAKAPKELLAEYEHALEEAAKVRVTRAAEAFDALPKKEREAARAKAKALQSYQVYRAFRLIGGNVWDVECPACKSKSFLAGVRYNEELSEDQDEAEFPDEAVDVYYVAEEFHCPACLLHLDSREAIEAAGVEVEHTETEFRQREYEPDYGND